MRILFLHGWHSIPGGVKPTSLKNAGNQVINPALDDDDFDAAVRIAQAEYDQHQPDVIVGSSRGGAVAMNIKSGDTPLVLLCPAWRKWGRVTKLKPNSVILHSRYDEVIPFADSEELVANSDVPPNMLAEVGDDHRLADPESLRAMMLACLSVHTPEWTDGEEELFQQDWTGLCYTAVIRWVMVAKHRDWKVVHGTVLSMEVVDRIEHAWCERGDTVVDLAMPIGAKIIERERYYRTIHPEVSKTYSSDDALFLSLKNRHHGPWDESEQLTE